VPGQGPGLLPQPPGLLTGSQQEKEDMKYFRILYIGTFNVIQFSPHREGPA
jgi:hypothetical protein